MAESSTHARGGEYAAPASRARRRLEQGALLVYVLCASVLLFALAFSAHTTPFFPFDLTLERDIQAVHAGWFDLLMRAVGQPGYPPQVYLVVAAIVVLLFAFGLRWEAAAEAFAIVGIGAVGLVIKILVNRPRPSPSLVYVANPGLDAGKFSFPAGHVESFVAIFGFLVFLLLVLGKPGIVRTLAIAFFLGLVVLIGPSRMYVGEHWFSDVVGGYLFGSAWLALTIYVYRWGKGRFLKDRAAEH